jgi:hypothetical protein
VNLSESWGFLFGSGFRDSNACQGGQGENCQRQFARK